MMKDTEKYPKILKSTEKYEKEKCRGQLALGWQGRSAALR